MKLYMILLTHDVVSYPYYGEPVKCFQDYASAYAAFNNIPSWDEGPGFGAQYVLHLVFYDVEADGEMMRTELERK
jgi:hypothetical protein